MFYSRSGRNCTGTGRHDNTMKTTSCAREMDFFLVGESSWDMVTCKKIIGWTHISELSCIELKHEKTDLKIGRGLANPSLGMTPTKKMHCYAFKDYMSYAKKDWQSLWCDNDNNI